MNLKNLQRRLVEQAKEQVRESLTKEVLVIQAIRSHDELIKSEKRLKKIAREWYSYETPEAAEKSNFLKFVVQKTDFVVKILKLEETLGRKFVRRDKLPLQAFGKSLLELENTKEEIKQYIKFTMRGITPNFTKEATSLIAARLLEKAGSMKQLAEFPSSTIQMLGAEKALFRHLIDSSSKSPKYGLIYSHPDVKNSKQKGKSARKLAGKLSLAIRKDYYKNEH